MKCFYHQTVDSVGSCRACGRGLCPDCVTEYDEGLACKNRCESAVQEVISLVRRNRTAVAKSSFGHYLFPVFFIVIGIVEIAAGLQMHGKGINALTAIGVVIFVLGIVYFNIVRRVYRA